MSGSRTWTFSGEEKEQLLANLDLEVAHRTRQFEEWMADTLEDFRRHQESLISRIPRIIRNVTMREFAKYNGDIQAAVKGLSRELLGSEDATIDLTTRKRKWVESQEADGDKLGKEESSRGVKNARTVAATPKKKPSSSVVPQSAQKSRLPITKTPAKTRSITRVPSGAVSPSPQKGVPKQLGFPRTPSRFASPTKSSQARVPTGRVPSSSTFNPVLPSEASHPRWPRKDERLRSVNGSPVANPYQLDLKNWFKAIAEEPEPGESGKHPRPTTGGGAGKALKKQRSIIIRSGSSSSLGVASQHGMHSRSASQASTLVGAHSPTDEQSDKDKRKGSTVNERASLEDPFVGPSFSALVSVQTKDGHVLEFNPLQTSPEELDALEGISDSAKKQAKEDMARMIQATFERWRIS